MSERPESDSAPRRGEQRQGTSTGGTGASAGGAGSSSSGDAGGSGPGAGGAGPTGGAGAGVGSGAAGGSSSAPGGAAGGGSSGSGQASGTPAGGTEKPGTGRPEQPPRQSVVSGEGKYPDGFTMRRTPDGSFQLIDPDGNVGTWGGPERGWLDANTGTPMGSDWSAGHYPGSQGPSGQGSPRAHPTD